MKHRLYLHHLARLHLHHQHTGHAPFQVLDGCRFCLVCVQTPHLHRDNYHGDDNQIPFKMLHSAPLNSALVTSLLQPRCVHACLVRGGGVVFTLPIFHSSMKGLSSASFFSLPRIPFVVVPWKMLFLPERSAAFWI